MQSIFSLCRFAGVIGAERVFLVDWKELTAQQQDAVLDTLSKRFVSARMLFLKMF